MRRQTAALLRLVPDGLGTAVAAFLAGSLWRAGQDAAAAVFAAAGVWLLARVLTGLQMAQGREALEAVLGELGRGVRVFAPIRLRLPRRGWIAVDYLIAGPEARAWPVVVAGVSQWPSHARAARQLARDAARAAAAAAAVGRALREGTLPASVGLDGEAAVRGLVVPLRRRVQPGRSGAVIVVNTEELGQVLTGRLDPHGPAGAPPPRG